MREISVKKNKYLSKIRVSYLDRTYTCSILDRCEKQDGKED